jgi:hypothetical protein
MLREGVGWQCMASDFVFRSEKSSALFREIKALTDVLFRGARFSAFARTIITGCWAAGVKRLIPERMRRNKLFDAGLTSGLE